MDKNKINYNNNKDIKENLSNFSSSINSGTSTTKVRNFYITLAKESPKNITYDSSSDTYDSFHLRETDYCKDTTDTLSDSSYTTEGIATLDVVEYEVASRSASEDLYSNDSSSGTEDFFLAVATKTAVTLHHQYDSSTSDFADSEESIDDIIIQKDAELSSADYWNCVKCKNKQNNPMFRYCEKCYQIRKSHFPPRPPQRKSRAGLRKKSSSTLNKYNSSVNNYNQLHSSLSSLSDTDKKDIIFDKIYNSSVTTVPAKTLTNDFNNLKGFGKFDNNDNNNNSGNSTKNVSESSSSKRLSYKNINATKSQLNSAAESSTDNDDDSNSSINNITISKFNQNTKSNESDEDEKEEFCSLLDSEDNYYSIHTLNKRKKLVLRDTKKITNFFSTPKFSNNLKRKNPFEISLVNNAKRIFVNNSSCSSVTNLTNNYSSSNNSSLTTTTAATSINNASSINLIEKRDTNLIINNSETDLGLELISNSSNSLKLQKDSGISGSSSSKSGGPSSSQELFSSQVVVDLQCSSSHSDDPTTSTNLICNNSSLNLHNSDDDTISEDLDENDYDSIDDELILKDNKYESKKSIEILKDNVDSPKTFYNKELNSEITTEKFDHNTVKITNYINLSKHLSDFPLSSPSNNEFSPTIRKNSIVTRSFSSCSNAYNANESPKSTSCIQVIKNQRKHRNILGQFNDKNKNDSRLDKIQEKNESTEGLDNTKNDSCIVCLDEPKNGVFVHSRFLHLCCCYKCAVKIWNKNKKCPVCNCAVKNVMKLFIH